MKALSIRQPWAWLIVNGYKDIENRTWPTKYRGPVLIHAAKTPEAISLLEIISYYDLNLEPADILPRFGGIVGQAEITDCVSSHESTWFHGPRGFVLENARPLPFEACRGRLGLFEVQYTLPIEATGLLPTTSRGIKNNPQSQGRIEG